MSTGAESKTSADAAAMRLLARLYQDDLTDSADEVAPRETTNATTAASQVASHARHTDSDDALSNSTHAGATVEALQRATARDEIQAFRNEVAATSDQDRGFDETLQRMRELRSVLSDMRTDRTPSERGLDTLLAAAAAAVAGRSHSVTASDEGAVQRTGADSRPSGDSNITNKPMLDGIANSNAAAHSSNAKIATSYATDGTPTAGAWHRWRASVLRIAARPAFAAAAGLVLVAGAAGAIYMRSGTMDAGTADSQARSASHPRSATPADSVAPAEPTATPPEAGYAQEKPKSSTENAATPSAPDDDRRASERSEQAAAPSPAAQGMSPRDDNNLADKKASPARGGHSGSQYGTVDQRVGVTSGGLTGGIGATDSVVSSNGDERKQREASKPTVAKAKRSAAEPQAKDDAGAAIAEEAAEAATGDFARPPTKITTGAKQPVASAGSGTAKGSLVSDDPSSAIGNAPAPTAPSTTAPMTPSTNPPKPGAGSPAPAFETAAASPPPPPPPPPAVRATKPEAKPASKAAATAAPSKNDSAMAGKSAPAKDAAPAKSAPITAAPTESVRDEKASATTIDTLVGQLRAAASRSDCATVQKLFARVVSLDGKRAQALRSEKSVAVCLTKQ